MSCLAQHSKAKILQVKPSSQLLFPPQQMRQHQACCLLPSSQLSLQSRVTPVGHFQVVTAAGPTHLPWEVTLKPPFLHFLSTPGLSQPSLSPELPAVWLPPDIVSFTPKWSSSLVSPPHPPIPIIPHPEEPALTPFCAPSPASPPRILCHFPNISRCPPPFPAALLWPRPQFLYVSSAVFLAVLPF